MEKRPHPLRPMGQERRLGTRIQRSHNRKNEYLMLDTTLVRAHQQAATGKGGTKTRLWGDPEED